MKEIKSHSELSQYSTFKEQDKDELVKRGYVIYTLDEISQGNLQSRAMYLPSSFYQESYLDSIKQSAIRSEVAINVNEFYMPQSNWKSLDEQRGMVDSLTKYLQLDGLAVKATIGHAADYVEFVIQHFEKTGEKVGESNLEDSYLRTLSHLENGSNVHLRNLHEYPKPVLEYDWDSSYGHKDVYVAPLLLPITDVEGS